MTAPRKLILHRKEGKKTATNKQKNTSHHSINPEEHWHQYSKPVYLSSERETETERDRDRDRQAETAERERRQ